MADEIVDNPTYMQHIRHFFDDIDLEHMMDRGIDLTTYATLKASATSVFQQTRPPNAGMPPDAARKWSAERSATFRNWITDGFPLGTPDPHPLEPATGDRIRKDVRDLSEDEVDLLKQAYQGLMGRPAAPVVNRPPQPDDGYFGWGSVHGLPAPSECLHHQDLFFPWHRPQVRGFEDALRSVPGCADVTLPYWDVTAEPPAFLYQAPFDAYRLPLAIPGWFAVGDSTQRFAAADVLSNMNDFDVAGHIATASAMFDWETFRDELERGGHDNGHVSTGATMLHPEIASYDPIFWMFHANWDRLWWEWQQRMQATTRWSFRSTITTEGNLDFLDTPPFNKLDTFDVLAVDTIDLAATGVGYAAVHSPEPADERVAPPSFGSLTASRKPRVRPGGQASIRLKGVNRMAIPGSFQAILSADGVPVARQAFFQPTEPRECAGCREKAVVDIDFRVDVDAILGKDLDAVIEVVGVDAERIGRRFPLTSAGDPTLNVRLPLQERA